MRTNTMRERLMASSMICGVAFAALAAGPAAAQDSDVAEIVVTGSRIPTPNLTSVSPVQVVTDQEFKLQGQTDTVDLLNDLPQVFQNDQAGFSSTSNPLSSPGGVSTVNLRGLGPQRTLVLVDGRRLGIGDPNTGNTSPAPDINQIPAPLIERVEVLTGGASATYGSDAIAGVVNFVMKRNFEGVQVDAQWGVNQHKQQNDLFEGLLNTSRFAQPKDKVWDGKSRDLSVIFGANSEDGRGNVTAYMTYHDQDPVRKSARDFAACQLNVSAAGTPACAGSSNSNIFYTSDGQSDAFAVVGNRFQPYSPLAVTSPPPVFNSNPYEYLLHDDTRYTGGFFARYDINDTFNLYSDFQYMHDRSSTEVAPSALFQGSGATPNGGFLINCNNPLMSAQQQGTFCTPAQIAAGDSVDLTIGRRNVEGGGRRSFYEHNNYRFVGGMKGKLAEPWSYDIYGSYYYTTLYTSNENYLSIARLQNALQVVNGPNGPVCASGAAGCVPYNIFRDGGVTQDQVDYLNSSGSQYGSMRENIIEATVTGDLGAYGLQSPMARDGVGVAFGAQNRRDKLTFQPDQASLSGDLSGFGGASTAINNTLRVNELYGEVRVPLVQDRAFFEDLLLEGGYRYSDYSTGIQAKTYKLGLQWAPTRDVRLRASYQSAIRAPNIIELYTPPAVTNTSQLSRDPCAPTLNPDGTESAAEATLEQCLRTGVTAAQYGNGLSTNTIVQCPAEQCAVLNSGNTDLDPERAKTLSVGLTFTPTFIPGFTASLDYYQIKLKDIIGALPLGVIMDNCLATGDQRFCGLIHRAPNGTVFGTTVAGGGYLDATVLNIGAVEVSGVDLQASYSLPMEQFGMEAYGGLSFSFAGSYLDKASTTVVAGEPTYDCAGLFGPQCQTLNPRWRHSLRATWRSPWDVLASISWRYIGSTTLETDSDQPTIGGSTTDDPFSHKLGDRSYIDISTIWTVNDLFTVRAGVNNVFDKDPPIVPASLAGSGSPNTYTTYDLLGRRMFIGFTANF